MKLAAARMLPRDTGDIDGDMKSIMEDLHDALQNYSHRLRNTNSFSGLPVWPCTETAVSLRQESAAACRLARYQMCLQQRVCPAVEHETTALNQDLLQHLDGSNMKTSSLCTSSSSESPAFDSMTRCIQCVQCWIQQVAALHPTLSNTVPLAQT